MNYIKDTRSGSARLRELYPPWLADGVAIAVAEDDERQAGLNGASFQAVLAWCARDIEFSL